MYARSYDQGITTFDTADVRTPVLARRCTHDSSGRLRFADLLEWPL